MSCSTPKPDAHRVMFAFRGDSAVLAVRGLTRDQANAAVARVILARRAWWPARPAMMDFATPDGRTFAVRVDDVVAAWVEAECECGSPAQKLMEAQAALQAEAVRRMRLEREERERGETWREGFDGDGETD